ncbi:hypothetical protein EW146_g1763 [Bondarzewia mesenterica]|uniref:Aspartate aminotransferase n=1 Tax=Bondarzewia mesenterica TaxID=1095465 RepID=A0A4S4M2Q4_9AGAM|nr:hypothetical protein EW146_g1763 [Bondarzewia mesenterica]
MASAESWEKVPLAPPDSIFKLTAAYKADPFPRKVNLGVGAYRDDDSKPWVLPVVKKASEILLRDPDLDHEYLPITGLPEFTAAAGRLILGADAPALTEGRVVSVQTISGTGANHLGALFLSRYYQYDGGKRVYLSDPTWVNHFAIFRNVGIEPVTYPYYDAKTIGLDYEGFVEALRDARRNSVFLLHACAHNPTGVDPTEAQWKAIAEVVLEKGHYAFFDCAYQGFASGDLDRDAWAVRYFASRGVPMLVCQSFAKNAGLYGERVGALHLISPTKEAADRVRSQMSVLQRSEISNPPSYGARVVSLILNDAELFEEWKRDIRTMAGRIIDMRRELFRLLTEELKTPGNWEHIVNQIGMFSFTGINAAQSKGLTEKKHIYLTANGRISMAGLNRGNVRPVLLFSAAVPVHALTLCSARVDARLTPFLVCSHEPPRQGPRRPRLVPDKPSSVADPTAPAPRSLASASPAPSVSPVASASPVASFFSIAISLNPNVHLNSANITPEWNSWSRNHTEMLFNKTVAGVPDVRHFKTSPELLQRCQWWKSIAPVLAQ